MSAQTAHRTNKIVVVDDDARIRDLLRRYLSQEGFEVTVAEDGRALNRLLLRDSVDLIVLDLMMPGEDGLSICRRLRAANDRTPIIMLTAKSEDVDRIVGLEVGADDYLGKPFSPRELQARIKALLRRADLIVVNETEAAFYGEALHRGGGRVVVTKGAQGAAMGLIREQRANRESVADPVLSRGAVNTDDSFHDALLGDRHGMCRCSHCESGTLRPVDVKFAISVLFCER